MQFKKHLPHWENRKLADISRTDVSRLHTEVGEKTPYVANRLMALLSTLYNFAIDEAGFDGKNPASRIKRFPEESRERYLLPDEVGAFFQALDAEGQPWSDLFRLSLFTGARRGNILAMRWSALELEQCWWQITAAESKNKKAMLVVLVPQAIEILRRRETENSDGSEWVFPSRSGTGHIIDIRKPWKRITKRAGIENLRIHDLRRTLGSWQAMNGASLPVIGKSLGHSSLSATQVYARLGTAPVLDSVTSAVKKLLIAADVTPKPLKTLPKMA